MEIKHYINDIEIEEPIGFDGFKTTIKRDDDYHGMSAESSVGELEFYGNAIALIRDAYNENVDSKLIYKAILDGETIYEGVIDLSTYKEIRAKYNSISCKIGEIGIKTTFNQRSDVDIDLNDDTDYTGNALVDKFPWHNLPIPPKNIIYTNRVEQEKALTYSGENNDDWHMPDDFRYALLVMLPENQKINEFGSVDISGLNGYCGVVPTDGSDWDGIISHFFLKNSEDWDEKFGNESKYKADIHLNITLTGLEDAFTNVGNDPSIVFTPILFYYRNKKANIIKQFDSQKYTYHKDYWPTIGTENFAIDFNLNWTNYDKLYVAIKVQNNNYKGGKYVNNPFAYKITLAAGSYIEMKLDSVKNGTVRANMMLVGDAISKIVAKISEQQLKMKSEWFKFAIGTYGEKIGGGALKAITDGYKIRGSFTDGYEARTMQMSFKSMIESVNVLDCIGWGFSNENGGVVIRVERWNWFYKDDVLIEIDGAKEITRAIEPISVVTDVNIGYKKYTTNDEISAVDSIHGERTFVSEITSVSNSKKLLCEFIADNYAIEMTRRNAMLKSESEYKYDENIFVFSLERQIDFDQDGNREYDGIAIANDVDLTKTCKNIMKPSQMINAILSPERCLWRWNGLLFLANGAKNIKFSSGKLNCSAQFGTKESRYTQNSSHMFLYDELQEYEQDYSEKGDVYKISRKFKADVIELTYPITFDQYKIIKNNPYGLVVVDGEKCWIKEFTYSFADGTADFKLIPKAEE